MLPLEALSFSNNLTRSTKPVKKAASQQRIILKALRERSSLPRLKNI